MLIWMTTTATVASLMILLHDLVLECLLTIHLIEVVQILTVSLLCILDTFLMNVFLSKI